MSTSSDTAPARHVRLCEDCGQVDDHPRHVASTLPGDSGRPSADVLREAIKGGLSDVGVAEALDDSTTVLHIDCCAKRGCDVCTQTVALAGGKKGAELTKFITSGKTEHLSTVDAGDLTTTQEG